MHYRFAMFCFSVLVNSASLDSLLHRASLCKTVFCSKHVNSITHNSHSELVKCFKSLGQLALVEQNSENMTNGESKDFEELIPEESSEEKQLLASAKKPFGSFFSTKLEDVQVCSDPEFPANPLYQPLFITKLSDVWLPMSPFWSSMLRGEFSNNAYSQSYC